MSTSVRATCPSPHRHALNITVPISSLSESALEECLLLMRSVILCMRLVPSRRVCICHRIHVQDKLINAVSSPHISWPRQVPTGLKCSHQYYPDQLYQHCAKHAHSPSLYLLSNKLLVACAAPIRIVLFPGYINVRNADGNYQIFLVIHHIVTSFPRRVLPATYVRGISTVLYPKPMKHCTGNILKYPNIPFLARASTGLP